MTQQSKTSKVADLEKDPKFKVYLIEPILEGVSRAINNSYSQLAQVRTQLIKADEETQQLILLKSQEMIDEVVQLTKVVNKLSEIIQK